MPPRGTVAILKGAAKIAKDRVAAFLGHRRRFYKDPSTVEAHDCQRCIDHRTHHAQLMRRLKRNPEQFFSRPATPKSLTSLRAAKKTMRSGDQVQQELIAHPTSIVSPRLAPIGFAGCKGCCGARHVTRVEVCTVGACAVGLGVASCIASLSRLGISESAQQPNLRSGPQRRSRSRDAGQLGIRF